MTAPETTRAAKTEMAALVRNAGMRIIGISMNAAGAFRTRTPAWVVRPSVRHFIT
jgi:hypothetical protein